MIPQNLVTLFFLFISISPSSLNFSHGLKITTRLIHRDSVFSPDYDATASVADRAERSIRTSLARHAASFSLEDQGDGSDVEAPLVLANDANIFYVNFSIGDPPVPQLAIMDTGSDLTWVKCHPCRSCSHDYNPRFFDTFRSKTYSPQPCIKACRRCTTGKKVNYCMFERKYLDGESTEGVYATDQLTFRTSSDAFAVVPNVAFGCCNKQASLHYRARQSTGILALGGQRKTLFGHQSLVTKLGSVFSYCVGSISDRSYAYNRLSIGAGDSDLYGDSTTFITAGYSGNYYIELQNISLGGVVLDIDSEVLTNISRRHGMQIDSGSEASFLYTGAFDVVKEEVRERATEMLLMEAGSWSRRAFELCYRGTVEEDARGFPQLGFHFANHARLIVDYKGMFIQVEDDVFCLAIIRSNGVSFVGIIAQQNYNFGFDLRASKVYFEYIDCELLQG